jgi:ABC-type branched-subunit amino acid transport system ATPase component
VLKLENINSYYGKSHILHDVSLSVNDGASVSVLGRNGAGKTTLLNTIIGSDVWYEGSSELDGEDISSLATFERIRKGIAFVPEDRGIFHNLTVEDNLRLATFAHKAGEIEKLTTILDFFPALARLTKRKGDTLSGGEMQMLAIARGIITRPKLLLLDEPTEGLAPLIVDELSQILIDIKEIVRSMLVVEENIKVIMKICEWHYILDKGRIEVSGTTDYFETHENEINEHLGV